MPITTRQGRSGFNNYSPRTPFEASDMDAVRNRIPVEMKTLRQCADEQDWSAASLTEGNSAQVGSVSG